METSNNELALVGWTESFGSGNSDCWLIVTDAQGDAQWNKTWGGESYDYAYSAVLTSDGGYILAGESQSFGAGSHDFLLIEIREANGDCNGDGKVDWKDLLILALAYGSRQGEPAYVAEADFNSDCEINWKDLLVLAQTYGKST